jgi:glycosyltransferase involved in cell wall biosynthesis
MKIETDAVPRKTGSAGLIGRHADPRPASAPAREPGAPAPRAAHALGVLFVTPGGIEAKGGMGRMAGYLIGALKEADPSIEFRVLDSYGSGRSILMPLHFAKSLIALAALCAGARASVVHINMAAYGSTLRKLLLLRAAALFGVPTVLHIHASEFVPFCEGLSPRLRRRLVRELARASRIVVIGEYWRRYLADRLDVPEARIIVIPNAVPLPPPASERGTDGPVRIVALGLIGARKGTPELVAALGGATLRALEWRAVIAGNGAIAEAQAQAAGLGLAQRIEFPGWVDRAAVARLLGAADIFVLPSHNEGLPIAILEAMAAGVAVVATPVGAIPELVLPGETGLLVPPGDTDALAGALASLVRDGDLRRRLGRAGRARIDSHFRLESAAHRFAALYRELAAA